MIKKTILTAVIIVAVAVAAVAAFRMTDGGGFGDGKKIAVAATYYPLYDFAKQVGGEKADVINITPAGAEPHDFEPSPQVLAQASKAEVFIYNGSQMEPWVDSFLKDYKGRAIASSRGITLLDADHDHAHDENEEGEHEEEQGDAKDPHFWLDPVVSQQIVTNIRDGLIEADPDHQQYYRDNTERYNQQLEKLDSDFADGLADCSLDTVISSHAAFSYLAARYNFNVLPIAGIEPSDEPSPAKMAEITRLVQEKGIRYIFFESLVSPRLAETIANESGATTLVFDPIEGLSQADQNQGKDYISVQYDNLRNLRQALDCR